MPQAIELPDFVVGQTVFRPCVEDYNGMVGVKPCVVVGIKIIIDENNKQITSYFTRDKDWSGKYNTREIEKSCLYSSADEGLKDIKKHREEDRRENRGW